MNDLVKTTWVGSESLNGYGRLEFRFQANGKATMIDRDGSSPGTWEKTGNTILARFYGGRVVYTGSLSNHRFAGTAKSDKAHWSFSVSDIVERIRSHNASRPNPANQAAVRTYNEQARDLNEEGTRLRAQNR